MMTVSSPNKCWTSLYPLTTINSKFYKMAENHSVCLSRVKTGCSLERIFPRQMLRILWQDSLHSKINVVC
jgi:hypothetical protein